MRSFASALTLGRGGRSDTTSTASVQSTPSAAPRPAKARSPSLFAKAPKTPLETTTAVLSRPVLTPGSSCSSDGSASLQTPEDEMPPFAKSDEKKRRSTWFGWRKPLEKGDAAETERAPPPVVSTSKMQDDVRAPPRRLSRQSTSESDDDDQSESESSGSPESSTVIVPRSAPPRVAIVQARANLRTLLRNTLNCPLSPPPLVETPSLLFPRSCAALGSSPQTPSLQSTMHVRNMLWRLDHRTLSDTEAQSILGLARKPQPKVASRNRLVERRTDDDIISFASMRVGQYSRGLRRWASRPCFEQRFLVWMPDEKGDVGCRPVMGVGRQLAVLELEVSEGVEALAGLYLDDETFEQNIFPPPPPPKKPAFNTTTRKQSSPPRKSPFNHAPSPLRLDHAAPAEPVLSTVSSLSSESTPILDAKSSKASTGASKGAPQVRSGITRPDRDDPEADESIPLGYAVQAKKRREEKARFLQAEKERRAKEIADAERQKREIERRRVMEEQKQKEEERRRVEEEKKAREERMKEKYSEEIAASRQRRENARLGMDNYTNIREMHQRQRVNGHTYVRPAYDVTPPVMLPRRSASDFAAPGDSMAKAASSNSRSAGMAESSQDKRRSLPPTSSNSGSRDVHLGPNRSQSNASQHQQPSRPPSIISSSSRPVSFIRTQSAPNQVPMMAYPMMPVMPVMPQMPQMHPIPPIPAMPVWNMPLLPPNAPFMMQQYSRSPSPGSNPHSRNRSPSSSPSRRPSGMPPSSPSRRQPSLHSSSPSPSRPHQGGGSPTRPTHARFPSGDNHPLQPPTAYRGNNGVSQRPSRSTSYSPLQQSVSQPLHRDDRSQKSRHGSTASLANMDPKRRTSMK